MKIIIHYCPVCLYEGITNYLIRRNNIYICNKCNKEFEKEEIEEKK